ncbi:MAG: calcium/sodium antiporter [Tidjanibacter sp.]|nr:calcium/sodium antiporter [Tidjanibacter sp.]
MNFVILAIGLALIVFGADYLINGSTLIAKRFKVSDFVIGMTIVGVGTSMPEFVVSFVGTLQGSADVAIGNVVGSNIANILFILGVTALIHPIAVSKANLRKDIPLCLGVSLLLTVICLWITPGVLGRWAGVLLLLIYAWFMYRSFKDNDSVEEEASEVKERPMWVAVVMVVGGLLALIFGGRMFVNSATAIAAGLGVSEAVISITVLAIGTSLPELAASIAAARQGRTQMALGNVVGSNIANIALILGLCATTSPLSPSGITAVDYVAMIAAVLLLMLSAFTFRRKMIDRADGAVMILAYVTYIVILLNR